MTSRINLACALISCAIALPAFAEKPHHAHPGKAVVAGLATEATVESIDYTTRNVTLVGPDGGTLNMNVPEFAHNFNQIKKGDKIWVEYTEALVLDLKKSHGALPAAVVDTTMERAPLGANPAGKITNTLTISALVESIDYTKRVVTLKGPEGKLVTYKVGPQAKHFKAVKKGDQVDATYTQALAMKLEKHAS